MKSCLPNIISGIRIALSAALLFVEPLAAPFYIIYALACASDVADGFLARRFHWETPFGAALDSIGDTALAFAMLIIFLPRLSIPVWALVWTLAIAAVRFASIAVAFVRRREFMPLHTIMNKAAGLALFAFPFAYGLLGLEFTAAALCSIASIASLEELLIQLVSKKHDRDIQSIFSL